MEAVEWSALDGFAEDDLRAVWPAFLASCRVLAARPAWSEPCAAAATIDAHSEPALRQFLVQQFQPWQVVNGDGSRSGLVTGYYEPLLKASRQRGGAYQAPIHAVPDDLISVDLSALYPELKNMRLRGRLDGRKLVPYYSRAELDARAEQSRERVLYWANDPIDVFFLQVQGSGRVELPDGSRVRLGYADQNGHPYQSIGRWLVERGELKLEHASMEGIRAWVRANPSRLNELLGANPSYVFFRELPPLRARAGEPDGPPGSLGVPLSPERSIAVDVRSVPLGAPVWLSTSYPNSSRALRRLMMAQDTGGAIKGGVRADFFWGFGAEAGAQAGRMRSQGQMFVLWPRQAGAPETAP